MKTTNDLYEVIHELLSEGYSIKTIARMVNDCIDRANKESHSNFSKL